MVIVRTIALALGITLALAAPHPALEERAVAPTVVLDKGTFTGKTSGGLSKFFGIPFALPP
jgi:hypothetical protein